MEITVLVTLMLAVFATNLGCFARNTRQAILFLSVQATAIGFMELIHCLANLLIGLHLEALIAFSVTFAEWFSCAVVIPLIIYWGMTKTENVFDGPIIGVRRTVVIVIATAILYMIVYANLFYSFPARLDVLPFSMLMFSLSVFLMVSRNDPLKILVGLSMAENALYPLFSGSPLVLIPFILVLMIFVTAVGVYITIEAYRDYGTMSISGWRWKD